MAGERAAMPPGYYLGLAVCGALLIGPRPVMTSGAASQQWRLRSTVEPPDGVTWSWVVQEVEFYSSFDVQSGKCAGWLRPSQVAASSTYKDSPNNGAQKAFDGVVKYSNGWNSASITTSGEEWLSVTFDAQQEVQCVRLYQSGLKKEGKAFSASHVVLEFKNSVGVFETASEWGSDTVGALPGWVWITLGSAELSSVHLATTECPEGVDQAQYRSCCTWPHFSSIANFTEAELTWLDSSGVESDPGCRDGATVKDGKQCEVKSIHCDSSGILKCVNSYLDLQMIEEDYDGCVQKQVDAVIRHAEEAVIRVEVTQYSPYCSKFSISDHPVDMYNGEYTQQLSFMNNKPWFLNDKGARLYYYNGCDGHNASWSLDNRHFDGCNWWSRGGWIAPPIHGGLPSGKLKWSAGEVAPDGTWELDCQGSHYVLMENQEGGIGGGCRDGDGKIPTSYVQRESHTLSTCRARCDTDVDCVAFNHVPPSMDQEGGSGTCHIYVPNMDPPAPSGWGYVAGTGASEVTAAHFDPSGEGEHGAGRCFLKVDWHVGSDGHDATMDPEPTPAPPSTPSPPSHGISKPSQSEDAANGDSSSTESSSSGLAIAGVIGGSLILSACICRGFMNCRGRRKDTERQGLRDMRDEYCEDDSTVVGRVVGKPSRAYVHNQFGGAIYGAGVNGVVRATAPGKLDVVRPAAAEPEAEMQPQQQQQMPGFQHQQQPEHVDDEEPEFPMQVEIDHSKAKGRGATASASRAAANSRASADSGSRLEASRLRDMGLLSAPSTGARRSQPVSASADAGAERLQAEAAAEPWQFAEATPNSSS